MALPGDQTDTVCMLRFAAPLPNLVVCSEREIEAVMGPLPSAPRVRTGHCAFDRAFAVFVWSSPADSLVATLGLLVVGMRRMAR